ncbi:alkaline phosphatase family protein [Sporosarcina sp.]|uniref:alkaline phosphatase family protein n=1 Tax=Sporosarcina sp. TaxID=49982 RepID=UPI00261763F2|nr:alkaline phosphatase family protein [Sporosarcina sp.]
MTGRIKLYMAAMIVTLSTTANMNQYTYAAESKGTISVVSFDGMGYEDTQRYINKGMMKNLEEFSKQSAYANNFVTVTPSLTAPSHAAMSTGAGPSKTGIVSNQFHSEGETVKNVQSGFSQTLGVTPIWKEARNQGKITATVAFPDSNPDNASAATYAVYSGGTLSESKLHNLKFETIDDERIDQLSAGHIKAQEAVVKLDIKDQPSKDMYVLAVEEGNEESPAIYLSLNRKKIGEAVNLKEWTSVQLDLSPLDSAGFYVKFKGNPAELDNFQLFQGTMMEGIYRGRGKFAQEMTDRFNFYPAPDETEAFRNGDITRKEYEETGERFIDWITDVSLHIKERYAPDLLFYYYPHVDHELHEFLLRDPAQPGYTMQNVQEKESYIDWAFEQADRVIGRLKNDLNKEDYILLVSDHGLEPIHTRISPNKELEKVGLLVTNDKGKIDVSKTKAYAEASGTIAHVYVNLKGREKKGIVSQEEYDDVKQQIVDVFQEQDMFTGITYDPSKANNPFLQWLAGNKLITYKYAGESLLLNQKTKDIHPYEKVLTEGMQEFDSISSENSGDVFLSAAPGYLMGKDAKVAIEPTEEFGSHGGDPERKSLRPILYMAGPTIENGKMENRIQMIDIAPTLYELLDIHQPDFVEGKPIVNK